MLPNAISESDSFLYFYVSNKLVTYSSPDPQKGSTKDISKELYQLSYYDGQFVYKKIGLLDTNAVYTYIKEAVNGELYVYEQINNPITRRIESNFHEILDHNTFTPALYKNRFSFKGQNSSFFEFPPHAKDHVRLSHLIDYACNATVQFTNNSSRTMEFDKFLWFIEKPNSIVDTLESFEPTITFDSSGDYKFKVHAISSKTGYSEWYIDSLYIQIPEKPIAAFKVLDTIICALQPVTFYNQSSTKKLHPTKSSRFVWTFGDGQTRTISSATDLAAFSYTYTDPGIYSVSLFFRNGYCDSTLVKNQLIKVVDAPKPGFKYDLNRGCSPLTINFMDTVSEGVTWKEYFYSDENSWQTVSSDNFNHVFKTAGTYYVVQRLHGYTGCITQLDTAWFFITLGITNLDTVHVINASYVHDFSNFKNKPDLIEISWSMLDAAVE